MFDYKNLLLQIAPITDVDLMFLNISPETRENAARQYNRALINAQGDGTDVAQVFLKPLIVNYPDWGDPALVFGLCLAREYEFKRASESVEYSIKKILTTQNNLYVAQESLKQIRDSLSRGDKKPVPQTESGARKGSAIGNNGAARGIGRDGMQAPILMRASHGNEDFKMASDKERREVMMRSGASGDEQIADDIEIESMRTPADKIRLTVNIVVAVVGVALIGLLVYFILIPSIGKLKAADANQERLNFLVSSMEEYSGDPEVAAILDKYVAEFSAERSNDSLQTSDSIEDQENSAVDTESDSASAGAEVSGVTMSPEEVAAEITTEDTTESTVPEETFLEPRIADSETSEPEGQTPDESDAEITVEETSTETQSEA